MTSEACECHYIQASNLIYLLFSSPSSAENAPMTPASCFDASKLAHKASQLRAATEQYESLLHWLCSGSRLHFGELRPTEQSWPELKQQQEQMQAQMTPKKSKRLQAQGKREHSQVQGKAKHSQVQEETKQKQRGTAALFLDSSAKAHEDGQQWIELTTAVKLLVKEQLSKWESVCLNSFGSSVARDGCQLQFSSDKEKCVYMSHMFMISNPSTL